MSVRVKRSFMCRVLHRFFCQCFHLDGNADEMDIITKTVRDFQRAEKQLVGKPFPYSARCRTCVVPAVQTYYYCCYVSVAL